MGISLNLVFNLSLLVAISVLSAIITDKTYLNRVTGPVLQGLLFGGAAVIGILFPVVLSPGLFFDGRSIILSLSGLFFGPLAGGIAVVITIITRILIGGTGTLMGVLVSLTAVTIGCLFHFRWKNKLARIRYSQLYLVGIVVHVVMVALMFTLPWEHTLDSLKHMSLPVLGFYPVATVIIGKILRDHFERIQSHEELVLEKEKAEQSNRLKDAFIANISHEIRTPLNAVLGFASIIEDEASDRFSPEEHIYFQRINQSGRRLTRTVDAILNYSRLMVRDLHVHKARINLPALTEALIEECKGAHPDHTALVVFENSIGPLELDIDEFCIRNSISNLLDNAMKYTASGSILVRLYQDDRDRVSIKISDTGIGMSEEFLTRIFEPYTQEDVGFTRRYEGVGLGLSIVKKLCDIMNAEISVASKKGAGSSFIISLPAEEA